MRRLLIRRALLVAGMVAGAFLLVLCGVIIAQFHLFPQPRVAWAINAFEDFHAKGLAYLGVKPVEQLEPLRPADASGARIDPERTAPGVTLIAGLFGDEMGARLIDRTGRVIHRWPINLFSTIEDKMKYPFDGLVHGSWLYPNGDLIANMDGDGLVRLDACGNVLWENRDRTHHSVFVDDAGFIWSPTLSGWYEVPDIVNAPFRFDQVAKFDPDTGHKLLTIDLVPMLVEQGLEGVVLANQPRNWDIIHINDVEVLSADMAAAFPSFAAGDIMLNSRHLNQIWILDGQTHTLKWWRIGPMHGAHDADFQPDGTITILDNRAGGPPGPENDYLGAKGGSRILRLHPGSFSFETLFHSNGKVKFYTPYRGKHQVLDNGNLLITETDAGRAFEVTPQGDVVWSYLNRYDEDEVGWLMEATRYPQSYASIAEIACPNAP